MGGVRHTPRVLRFKSGCSELGNPWPVQFVYRVWLVKVFSIMMGALGFPWLPTKARSKDWLDWVNQTDTKKSLAWILAKIKFYDIDLQISTRTTSTTSTGCIWPGVAGKLLGRLQILASPVVPPCGVAPGSWQLFKLGRWICKIIYMANNILCEDFSLKVGNAYVWLSRSVGLS